MYLEDLIQTFEEISKTNFPEINNENFIKLLEKAIVEKKYDLQDQTLIEAILSKDKETFLETYIETLNVRLEKEEDRKEFLNSNSGQSESIQIYIKSIEYMIDYYYNSIISKQFSST